MGELEAGDVVDDDRLGRVKVLRVYRVGVNGGHKIEFVDSDGERETVPGWFLSVRDRIRSTE